MTRPLDDGEVIEFRDRRLQALHRPGHSPSDTVFWDEERQILIAADHLIAHISSNPLIARPLDGSDAATQALVTYIESMRKTREMPAEIVLSGHGEPITDHVALIDERLAKTRAAQGEDLQADRRAAAQRLRDRPGDLGQRRRHPGLPHPLRGDRPRRPAGQRGPGARSRRRGGDPL